MPYSGSVRGPPTNRPRFNSPSSGCNSTRVLIMGHSFVRRADQYLRNKRIRNLHLPLSEFSVTLQGRGGAYACHLPELYDKCNVTPDMVVIDIGTNDLSMVKTDDEATNVAKRVYAFANTLVARGVKQVVILEVLPRTRPGRHGAPRSFDSLVASFNWQITRLCSQNLESPHSLVVPRGSLLAKRVLHHGWCAPKRCWPSPIPRIPQQSYPQVQSKSGPQQDVIARPTQGHT